MRRGHIVLFGEYVKAIIDESVFIQCAVYLFGSRLRFRFFLCRNLGWFGEQTESGNLQRCKMFGIELGIVVVRETRPE